MLATTLRGAYARVVNYAPPLQSLYLPPYVAVDAGGRARVPGAEWRAARAGAKDDYDACFYGSARTDAEWREELGWVWVPETRIVDARAPDPDAELTLHGFFAQFEPWLELKAEDVPPAPAAPPFDPGEPSEVAREGAALLADFGGAPPAADPEAAMRHMGAEIARLDAAFADLRERLRADRSLEPQVEAARARVETRRGIFLRYRAILGALKEEARALREEAAAHGLKWAAALADHAAREAAAAARRRDKASLVAAVRAAVLAYMRKDATPAQILWPALQQNIDAGIAAIKGKKKPKDIRKVVERALAALMRVRGSEIDAQTERALRALVQARYPTPTAGEDSESEDDEGMAESREALLSRIPAGAGVEQVNKAWIDFSATGAVPEKRERELAGWFAETAAGLLKRPRVAEPTGAAPESSSSSESESESEGEEDPEEEAPRPEDPGESSESEEEEGEVAPPAGAPVGADEDEEAMYMSRPLRRHN